MRLDPVSEVQNQKPRTTLRVERLLREAEHLSPEEMLQFFSRWMEKQDVNTALTFFLACMRSEPDDKLKKFVSWMHAESGNRKFLKEIAIKARAVRVTKGFTTMDRSEIDHWIKAAVEKDDGQSTDQIAHACKNYFRLPEKMVSFIIGQTVHSCRHRMVKTRHVLLRSFSGHNKYILFVGGIL